VVDIVEICDGIGCGNYMRSNWHMLTFLYIEPSNQSFAHLTNEFKSVCSLLESACFNRGIDLGIVSKHTSTCSGISLKYSRNNTGPITEPWGTLLDTVKDSDAEPFKTTCCD